MKRLAVAAALLALAAPVRAGEMKQEVKLGPSNPGALRSLFGAYGYRPGQSLLPESSGLRLRLPGRVAGVGQTGVYSYFGLSGDAEASCSYGLLNVEVPAKGYGSGVGLAFDAGERVGRGSIQRVHKSAKESGYVLQTTPGAAGGSMKEEYRFVASAAKAGRMGLRREKKELVFLAADGPGKPLEEIGRLPFTDRTIRAVRFFADPGESPTAVDVRVGDVLVRAEEIAGGVPRRERRSVKWWVWGALAVPALGMLLLGWRAYRRKSEGE